MFLFRKRSVDAPTPVHWRTYNEDLLSLKEKIEKYTPSSSTGISQARILMIGKIGAGKSSVCNTINSIFYGGITHPCPCGSADKSFTKLTDIQTDRRTGKERWKEIEKQ
ncbi:hypothetical protein CHS0354_009520 [Potamilus streckersoni]|uniref:AIG1-type G domain-containing protein n=1 Tax=Potamilus streckersoni TaxID=2493646 RepID=A0AAE0SPS9_9BIVA|nr:hypothetical protein CHS0354_009520 [Potamilus streckersoni]